MNLHDFLFPGKESEIYTLRAECAQWKRVCDLRTAELERALERAEKAEADHKKLALDYDAMESKNHLLEDDMRSMRELIAEHLDDD